MNLLIRLALVCMVFFGTYVLSWIVLLVLPFGDLGFFGNLLALLIAVLVARAVWQRGDAVPDTVLGAVGYGAAILGSIGFAAGFFGPMIFAPGANQGPMLGIFITGPGGALLGAVAGFAYGLKRARGR
jgi:hypothetical protein